MSRNSSDSGENSEREMKDARTIISSDKGSHRVYPMEVLHGLLVSLFSQGQFRRWLHHRYGEELLKELPEESASHADVVDKALFELKRHGNIDRDFFEALQQARPGRQSEIRAIYNAWCFAPSDSVGGPAKRSIQDRNGSRWLFLHLRLGCLNLVIALGIAVIAVVLVADRGYQPVDAMHLSAVELDPITTGRYIEYFIPWTQERMSVYDPTYCMPGGNSCESASCGCPLNPGIHHLSSEDGCGTNGPCEHGEVCIAGECSVFEYRYSHEDQGANRSLTVPVAPREWRAFLGAESLVRPWSPNFFGISTCNGCQWIDVPSERREIRGSWCTKSSDKIALSEQQQWAIDDGECDVYHVFGWVSNPM